MPPARRILGYLRPYALRYVGGVACLILATLFSLGIPWTVKAAVEALERGEGGDAVGRYVAMILGLAAAHGAVRLGSRFAVLGAGQWVEHDVRRDIYARLLALPPRFYHVHLTGDLMSRASNDVAAIRLLAGFGALMLVGTGLVFSGTLVAMWLIDPWLTLCAFAPFPCLIALAKRFNHAVDVQSTAVQEQLGTLSARVQENLTGSTVVRAYTMEAREILRFGALNREYLARSLRFARTQSAFFPLMGLIAGLGTLIILWVGGRAVLDGRISLGAFVAFNGYLAHLAWPTMALGWTLANLRRGLAAMDRISEILDAEAEAPRELPRLASSSHRAITAGAIEFRNLHFTYAGRAPALRGVTFTVPDGGMVAVVGPTGSGKSTLGLLVCRLFEPPPGAVLLGGLDVLELPLADLRRSVGYVPQEPFLFSRTLRENMLLADGGAGLEQVRVAAEIAGLQSEVDGFPQGWETVVGERGLTVSGGQRARVALARALVASPLVLILDDAFAAVDAGKESEVLRLLRSARQGRTTLLITHRLHAARDADAIVVLDEGLVVEQGTHAGLLARRGLYARLWRAQQIEDELART